MATGPEARSSQSRGKQGGGSRSRVPQVTAEPRPDSASTWGQRGSAVCTACLLPPVAAYLKLSTAAVCIFQISLGNQSLSHMG